MSNCRLCNCDDLKPRHNIGSVVVEGCRRCGFVQVRDRPKPEDLAALYSPAYFDHGKYTDPCALNKENARRMALIRGQGIRPGERILEVGCATGDFLGVARRLYDLWGLDVSEYAAREAQRRNPQIAAQISFGPVEDQDYPDDFFDAVVMWDVLEHLWDPVGTCPRLLQSLKPGGHLFISTPNMGALTARIMGRYWAFMTVPEHLGFYNRSTMTFLLRERLHLEVVQWKTRGKWANLGFLLYKIRRIWPRLVPQGFVDLFRTRRLGRIALYVPSGDVQYAVARKPPARRTSW